jgi:hypothetical protein
MKVATFLLEDRKLSPNEALSADKRAYSSAVLVYTDAVALLQGRIVGRRCVLCPLRSGLQNRKVHAEPVRVRIRTEAAGPSREGAPRAGSGRELQAFCANVLPVATATSECLSGGKADTSAWVTATSECFRGKADTSAWVRVSADTLEWVNHNGASSLQIES